MPDNHSLVVTSISRPNKALKRLAEGSVRHGVAFLVIGDAGSPSDFQLDGCDFFSLDRQRRTDFDFAGACPERHYARKNIGYLIAAQRGATTIIETDDDNLPDDAFWANRRRSQTVPVAKDLGWLNVYKYFTECHIWPRGYSLEHLATEPPAYDALPRLDVDCPIQQGLANENPDVDAIYRLTMPLPQLFRNDRSVAISAGTWCSFNSQNTTWWRDAFPLLYLPSHCSFRMTDIWRSFVAQRVAWANQWGILFHEPTVRQERNEHDLMHDFNDEIVGYLNNRKICEELENVPVKPGRDNIGDNLKLCYEKLIRMFLIPPAELDLLEKWLGDLGQCTVYSD